MLFIIRPNKDHGTAFINWWKEAGVFTKFIFVLTVASSILSTVLFLEIYFMFCFNPLLVIEVKMYWQLFTFPYACLDPLSALFSLSSYMPICTKRENQLGTFRFIVYFTTQNLLIALTFVPLYYLLSYIGVPLQVYFFKLFLSGLWPSIMAEMVLSYNENSEEITDFMCFPIRIQRKLYPVVFFLFFSVLFGIAFELLAGLAAGYLYLYGFMKWTEISDSTAKFLEGKLCCCFVLMSNNFVSLNKSGYELPRYSTQSSGSIFNGFVPFSGTGHRLGGEVNVRTEVDNGSELDNTMEIDFSDETSKLEC